MHRILFSMLLLSAAVCAEQPALDRLLAEASPPVGVVIEIVEDDENALEWALPEVARISGLLRQRFPDLPISVVAHGREQFGLLAREASGPLASVHVQAQSLREASVELHVCGTHAEWYGHAAEDFPDYVDVAASGPAQIRDYRRLGYKRLRLRRDAD